MTDTSRPSSDAEHSGVFLARPRVVVVDDSAPSRAALAEALEEGGCEVVGRAMDGGMALRMVLELKPDVVTCDLEMPRMDGFTFIRVITHKSPVPIIVVTSDSRPEAALQALDLGARDFVVKPGTRPAELRQLGATLVGKVRALASERIRSVTWTSPVELPRIPPRELVVIGASTGGPSALRDLLVPLAQGPAGQSPFVPVVIVQHMPPRFTAAFADRLRRATGLDVQEARDRELLAPGMVRVAPGGFNVEIARAGKTFITRIHEASPEDRHVPSVDRLLKSAAAAVGDRVLGIVLTGMGKDGADGAAALAAVGAPLWAESRATAVIDGMPAAAARAHGNATRLPLDELALLFSRVVRMTGSGTPA